MRQTNPRRRETSASIQENRQGSGFRHVDRRMKKGWKATQNELDNLARVRGSGPVYEG